ncbi:MAG: YceI family protein [Reichenbachiella sp.]|uniref:YceI family protein n=2 Tax=Reichenbachiella sp. TaxID=2184521 RepID=UPI0032665223
MKNTFIIMSVMCFSIFTKAQTLKLEKAESTMEILGTSSLHDWESNVEEFVVKAALADNQIRGIHFTAIVRSIKSGKSGMDNNTYKALEENKYPEIQFTTDQLTIQGKELLGKGELLIAGKSNEIPVRLTINNTSKLSVSGSIKIKMTDYGITPPTAVFGTIKTGDDITIQFDFTLIKS